MQKKFISNLAFLVILNFLVKPIAIFGIDATVQNQVGADSYGIYFSLLNFSISTGGSSEVEKTVTKIESIKTTAPIANE